jgi:hypothetical protein
LSIRACIQAIAGVFVGVVGLVAVGTVVLVVESVINLVQDVKFSHLKKYYWIEEYQDGTYIKEVEVACYPCAGIDRYSNAVCGNCNGTKKMTVGKEVPKMRKILHVDASFFRDYAQGSPEAKYMRKLKERV